eukprot:1159625-Pelagomonas_calceolata.AAC.4
MHQIHETYNHVWHAQGMQGRLLEAWQANEGSLEAEPFNSNSLSTGLTPHDRRTHSPARLPATAPTSPAASQGNLTSRPGCSSKLGKAPTPTHLHTHPSARLPATAPTSPAASQGIPARRPVLVELATPSDARYKGIQLQQGCKYASGMV